MSEDNGVSYRWNPKQEMEYVRRQLGELQNRTEKIDNECEQLHRDFNVLTNEVRLIRALVFGFVGTILIAFVTALTYFFIPRIGH